MKSLLTAMVFPLMAALACTCAQGEDGPTLHAAIEDHQVVVKAGDALFTAYQFAPDNKYPHFWPVNGPVSGKSVTTRYTEPYPHHRSLFFGCDKVNGGNYWQEGNDRGQIVSQGPEIVKESGEQVEFRDTCLWRIPGEDPIIRDTRRVGIAAPLADIRLIDFEITLEALCDVVIERSNHSLFAARMDPALSVQGGGVLVNAEGKTGEAGTFGERSAWCDSSGARDGVTEGLAILQHPENRWHPAPWFTRDYGFFSPTPMYWIEEGRFELPQGERLTLRYRVVVHAGDAQQANITALYAAYK